MKQLSTTDNVALQQRKTLYRSSKWRRFRLSFLKREPYCVMCKRDDRLTLATVLDHVNGHGLDWEAHFWDESGLQPLCPHHHATKTAQEIRPDIKRPWRA